MRAYLRRLDRRAAGRADAYLAVSDAAREQIERVYGIDATTLYPPVAVERFRHEPDTGDYHLFAGRLLPHRNAELAVRAFSQVHRRLVVVGDGPCASRARSDRRSTVEFRGVVGDEELIGLYARCRAVVVPGVEDFGLIPLEANASGRPAVAYGVAGALETVVDGVTGVTFDLAEPGALIAAVERAEEIAFDPVALRTHAERFTGAAFAGKLKEFIAKIAANHVA